MCIVYAQSKQTVIFWFHKEQSKIKVILSLLVKTIKSNYREIQSEKRGSRKELRGKQ